MFSNVLIKGYGHDDHKGCDHKGYDNKGQTAFIMFAIGAAALAAYLQANPAPRRRRRRRRRKRREEDLQGNRKTTLTYTMIFHPGLLRESSRLYKLQTRVLGGVEQRRWERMKGEMQDLSPPPPPPPPASDGGRGGRGGRSNKYDDKQPAAVQTKWG
jgi:hypothetical protein